MQIEMKPNKDGSQSLLDFQDRSVKPQSFKLKDGHTVYIEHEGNHHVVYSDMNIYQLKRKSKPSGLVVQYDSHIDRYQHFIALGFLV